MDTVLFYTFSTIAQTLAGAIALIGAVVLYQLQSFDRQMNACSLDIRTRLRDPALRQAIGSACATGRFVEVQEIADNLTEPITEEIRNSRDGLRSLTAQTAALRRAFRWSLRLTATVILLSVLALALTRYLDAMNAAPLTLAVGLGLLALCLISYVNLFRVAFRWGSQALLDR